MLEQRSKNPPSTNPTLNGRLHTNHLFNRPSITDTSQPTQTTAQEVDPDLEGAEEDNKSATQRSARTPTMCEIASILCSLIDQGLLHGFISHRLSRFAIVGAKSKPALEVGFPVVWRVVKGKAKAEQAESAGDRIPGWVKHDERSNASTNIRSGPGIGRMRVGPGMVVNLTGARPAGAPPM